jgi:hypothetical protein
MIDKQTNIPGHWNFSGAWGLGFGAYLSFLLCLLCFSSWPISVHGVGTVRHWAAMKLSIVQCRHNVSARDGGIPASRKRFGMARPGQRAGLGLPMNASPATLIVHSIHLPNTRPADAAVLTAVGDLSQLHRPAPAAGLTSFHQN